MIIEKDKDRILEFFKLTEFDKISLKKFTSPILVYRTDEDNVYFSIWEERVLYNYGISNVDGWDYVVSVHFAPDWIIHNSNDNFDDDFDDNFDDDFDDNFEEGNDYFSKKIDADDENY